MKRRPMRRGPGTSAYATRARDTDWLLAVKRLSCWAIGSVDGHVCEGPIEADHVGSRGVGRKCPDDETIPLCTLAHRQRTDFSGPFRSWDRSRMRAWLATGLEQTRDVVTKMLNRVGGPSPSSTFRKVWN